MTESPRAGQEHLPGGMFTEVPGGRPSGAEPVPAATRANGGAAMDARTPRWLLAVISAGVVTLFLLQAPGRLVADTKMDVPLDPLRFMERATHLWNSSSDFGFLPNQYIGYLFPMGPFFLIGKLAHVPPWITQRLWMALIVTVAIWGAVRLADALRLGRPLTRVVGGLAYGLSPVFLGKVGVSSIALTGPAMLPWITLPLVLALRSNGAADQDSETDAGGRRDLSPRRAAALSGLAIVCTSGVNASVTLCVLLCPAVLLLLAGGSRRAWALRAWWVLAVILATTWWLVALFSQVRFGLNFLPYTETATTTTSTTSVAEALRGTTDWLGYLRVPSAWLPAASVYVTNAVAILGTALAAGLGLWGLARRDLPARRFLLVSFAVGVVAVSAAFPGVPGSPVAGVVRQLLAGQFGFLRNVYKFEAVAHLPMALGLAHGLQVALDARSRRRAEKPASSPSRGGVWLARSRLTARPRLTSAVALVAVVAALGTGLTPALTAQMTQAGTFTGVPDYWHDAADWLADNPQGGRTLVLPALPFASYDWGRPLDEPMSWLSSTPWASRSLVPLGNVGMTRWMDAIEQELSLGSAPGLVAALSRAGVGQVLIRNDLDDQNWDIPPSTSEVYRALATSGLRHAASFGPMVAERASARDRLISSLATPTGKVPALDVWVVPGGTSAVSAYPADSTMVVSGGAEAAVQLTAHGLLGADRALVLASDLAPAAGQSAALASASGGLVQAPPASEIIGPTTTMVATDTFTRRDTQFGAIHDNTSYLLGADEDVPGSTGPPSQWIDVPPDGHQTVAAYAGGVRVRASSYGSSLVTEPDVAAAAAVDGLPYTSWTVDPAPGKGSVGGWIEVDVPRAVSLPYLEVQLLEEGAFRPAVQAIRVTTQRGSVVTQVQADEATQRLAVPPGPTTSFRVTFETVTRQGNDTYGAGIRELTLPGVPIEHYAQVPSDTAALFAGGEGQVAYAFDREAVDVTEPFGGSEELTLARRFDVPRPMSFAVQGTMTAIPSTFTTTGSPNEPFVLACGHGPTMTVDGTRYDLRVDGVQADVADVRPLRMSVCTPDGTIPLSAGQHLLTIDSGDSLLTSAVSLIGTNVSLTTDKPRSTSVTSWGDERRTVHIGSGTRAILSVHENSNVSWTATLDGQTLTPIRLDGWQQGWIVPAGSGGTVVIVNSPGHEYRVALVVGAVLLLVLVALAVLPTPRRFRRGRRPDRNSSWPGAPAPAPASGGIAGIPNAIIGGALATLAVFLVAGPVALAVPLFVVVSRRRADVLPWAGLAFMIVAGIGVVARPDPLPGSGSGAFSWYVQGAGALAFAATAAALALGSTRPGPAGDAERPAGDPERPAGDPEWPAGDPEWPAGDPEWPTGDPVADGGVHGLPTFVEPPTRRIIRRAGLGLEQRRGSE